MDEKIFTNIWYFNYHFMNNNVYASYRGKYEAEGVLTISDQVIVFTSAKGTYQIDNIDSVMWERRTKSIWNRIYRAFGGIQALLGGLFLLTFGVWNMVETGEISGASIMLSLGAIFALLGGFRTWIVFAETPWVVVQYCNDKGEPFQAYFADGRIFGWWGMAGGTKKLYRAIQTAQGFG